MNTLKQLSTSTRRQRRQLSSLVSQQKKTLSSPLVLFSEDENDKMITLTLNSPQTYNALTVPMGIEFCSLIGKLRESLHDGSLNANVCILTGAGKAFSSGGDLTWLRSRRDVPVHLNADGMRDFYESFLSVRSLPVPVIAAINGPAIGAGACLSLACDMRVAKEDVKIGFNFATLGIHAGMGASHFLPRTIGEAAAKEALLTGRIFSGSDAFKVGLINRIVQGEEPGAVLHEAKRLAIEVSRQNPLAVRSMTRSLRMEEDYGLETALRREADAQALCYSSKDWGEGLDAVVERRAPEFSTYHDR